MKSLYSFIVKPLNERYDNVKKVDDKALASSLVALINMGIAVLGLFLVSMAPFSLLHEIIVLLVLVVILKTMLFLRGSKQ